nr:unnamed protein product [Homo sapiens]
MAATSPGPWVSSPTHRSCFLPFLTRGCHNRVWAAHPFLLWPHQSCCWWMESSRWWWSAWSLMLHPLALTAPGRKPGSPVWGEGSYLSSYPTCPAQAWCSRSALRAPSSSLGAFFAGDLPPPLQAGAA